MPPHSCFDGSRYLYPRDGDNRYVMQLLSSLLALCLCLSVCCVSVFCLYLCFWFRIPLHLRLRPFLTCLFFVLFCRFLLSHCPVCLVLLSPSPIVLPFPQLWGQMEELRFLSCFGLAWLGWVFCCVVLCCGALRWVGLRCVVLCCVVLCGLFLSCLLLSFIFVLSYLVIVLFFLVLY
jgi:hypothetical protein